MMGMRDVNVNMIPTNPMRQESLIAAHNLLRELEANDSLTDDMKKILADLDSKLSAMELKYDGSNSSESVPILRERELNDAKEKLKSAHDKIMGWDSNLDMIWESGPDKAAEYIEAVEDVLCLVELFRSLWMKGDDDHEISQAEDVLQVAMQRLEEELVHVLGHQRQSYVPREVEGDEPEGSGEQEDVNFDLIDPEAIPFLKSIKKVMFDAKYDQDFCAAYVKTQKEALEDCLIGLGMETVSIDELVRMDWNIMASKIKTWVLVIRTAVQVYFSAEKRLCDEILGKSEPFVSLCLTNITKSAMTCLFNFGHAMALGPHTPEKLFYILDMYEVLVEIQGKINEFFSEEGGSYVKTEFEEVKSRLGDSARATFLGFGEVILSDPTLDPFPGGGVHPLSSYVMNYIIVYLPDYCKTLNTLLHEKDEDANNVTTNQVLPEKSLLASNTNMENSAKSKEVRGIPTYGGTYTMYNILGTLFEVSSKYAPPIQPVGRGAYGIVCCARNSETNEDVAIKKIADAFNNRIDAKRTLREIKLLCHMDHDNVIKIKDIIRPPERENFNDVYIVYELLDTDLHQIIRSTQELTEDHCQYFLYQILRGLKYIHSANVLHRDLKPSNLLLNANCDLKICDFGLARTTAETDFMTEYVVTRWYRAPELLLNCSEYTAAIDMWSVGCIMMEIIKREPLFPGKDYLQQLQLINELLGSPEDSDLGFLRSENAKMYIKQLPRVPKQPFSHKFPSVSPVVLDLAEKMLVFDPSKRITVDEALNHPYLSSLHEINEEPTCPKPFQFDFEQSTLDEEDIKELVWRETLKFNPDKMIE